MSFNSKNLHYEKQEPAFLRRLKGENPTSDRHNVAVNRPRKPRLETGGDDDGPTIVDERGECVTEQEYKDLVDGKTKNQDAQPVGNERSPVEVIHEQSGSRERNFAEESSGKSGKQLAAAATAAAHGLKKRRRVKAIAADPHTEEDSLPAKNGDIEREVKDQIKTPKKPKKKKIQLSFDDSAA